MQTVSWFLNLEIVQKSDLKISARCDRLAKRMDKGRVMAEMAGLCPDLAGKSVQEFHDVRAFGCFVHSHSDPNG
jgi:hypothetical protein